MRIKPLTCYAFGMESKHRTGIVIAALLAAAIGAWAHEAPLLTDADWRFRVGDDLAWAEPEQDGGEWEPVSLPHNFDARRPPHVGWYRLRFTVSDSLGDQPLAFYLGRIRNANEVYLNGEQIGADGRIGRDFVDAPQVERVYAIPRGLLRTGPNLLAIRVQSSTGKGAISGDAIQLGTFSDVAFTVQRSSTRRKVVEAGIVGMLAMVVLIWVLLYTGGERSPDYVALGALMVLLTALFLLESLILYDAGLVTPFTQRLAISLFLLLPVPFLFLGFEALRMPLARRIHVGTALLCLALACLYFLVGGLRLCIWMEQAWWGTIGITGTLMAWQAWRLRGQLNQTTPRTIVVGLAWLVLCAIVDGVVSRQPAWDSVYGVFLYVGFGGLVTAMACALALRVGHIHARTRALSRQLVTTQERERERLAAALHNGVAPALAAIKLDLQILLRELKRQEEGRTMVDGLSLAIDSLRTISHELRPTAVDQLGLCAALRGLASRLASQHGWELHLRFSDDSLNTTPPVFSHGTAVSLYRMAQEALHNIAKYADASHVHVTLTATSKSVVLIVADDGRGCDVASRTHADGLGWLLLRERAEALGGTCTITASPGVGVEVRICLPNH